MKWLLLAWVIEFIIVGVASTNYVASETVNILAYAFTATLVINGGALLLSLIFASLLPALQGLIDFLWKD